MIDWAPVATAMQGLLPTLVAFFAAIVTILGGAAIAWAVVDALGRGR